MAGDNTPTPTAVANGITGTSFAKMKEGQELIVHAGNDLRTHHSEAQHTVQGLAAHWDAESRTTFIGIMDNYDIEHQTMLQALEEIERTLEQALGVQIQADDDSDLVMGQLRAALEGHH